MGRRAKKKLKAMSSISTEELLSGVEINSENIIRLKLTTRKGTRIESVPLRKLEKVASHKKLFWQLQENWLILYGIP